MLIRYKASFFPLILFISRRMSFLLVMKQPWWRKESSLFLLPPILDARYLCTFLTSSFVVSFATCKRSSSYRKMSSRLCWCNWGHVNGRRGDQSGRSIGLRGTGTSSKAERRKKEIHTELKQSGTSAGLRRTRSHVSGPFVVHRKGQKESCEPVLRR